MARTRTRTKTKLIIFSINDTEDNYFGFKIASINEAKKYLLSVKKLQENNSSFTIGTDSFQYNSSYFSVISLSSSDEKSLINLFDIDIEDDLSNNYIGIMPNAIDDAYDEGLIEDQQEDDDSYQQDQYSDDYF